MLTHVQAVDRQDARELLKRAWVKGTAAFDHHRHVAWVGIEPAVSPLRHFKVPKSLIVTIPDVTAPEDRTDEERASWGALIPTDIPTVDHVRPIYQFVQDLIEDERPWCLMIHCAAGVSRSPAVATWVNEQYKVLSSEAFQRLHPGIIPNRTLLRHLRSLTTTP